MPDRPSAWELTRVQAAKLEQAASDATTSPRVAARARLVLAAARPGAGFGPASAADRKQALRWLRRYRDEGLAGLDDRPRPGRPRQVSARGAVSRLDDDLPLSRSGLRDARLRDVLAAPLLMPSPSWSSADVAAATATSQSTVARAWLRAYTNAPDPVPGALPETGLQLVACAVSASNRLLLLAEGAGGGAAPPIGTADVMRHPVRRPLQTLLSADLFAAARPAARPAVRPVERDGDAGGDRDLDLELVRLTRRRIGRSRRLFLLSRRPVLAEASGPVVDGATAPVHELTVGADLEWQALLRPLIERCGSSLAVLLALQHALMEWARGEAPRFEWSDAAVSVRPAAGTSSTQAPTGPRPRATAQVLADQAFSLLVDRIASGRLVPGERVTEVWLARTLRTSRGHARDALRTLASNNLLDLEPHRGAVVPAPQVAHIIETYAARRALGTLLVRRAVHWAPGDLEPVDRALDHLLAVARTNDSYATGDADLAFQDTLADATRMARIAPMFRMLTSQLRLYIALLGLRYVYPIPEMCQDDADLLSAVRQRREVLAVKLWNAKIDRAVDAMTVELRQRRSR